MHIPFPQATISRALILILGMLLAPSTEVCAQTATLSGSIRDAANGRALGFVSIVLQQEGRTVAGAASSPDGLFLIPRLEPGCYVLRATFVGYDAFTDTLQLAPGEVRRIAIALRQRETELGEVVVQSERGGAADITAGQQTVTPADIERIPTPDLSADLASYLTALPGVVTTGDRGGQLYIRGGEPSQNLILLDGIPLLQPFHLLGFYSAFPASIISHTDLYAGGFGARYGDHLSSVIDVASRNGNSRRLAGAATLSPFIASARLEGPVVTKHVSFQLSARQSMIEHLAQHVVGQPLPFVFGDLFAKVHAQPGPTAQLSLTALHTYDRGTVGETVGGSPAEELRWRNKGIGLRYLVLPRALPVIADLHFSYARLASELGPTGNPVRSSTVKDVRFSVDGTFPGERVTVQAGTKLEVTQYGNDLGGLYQNVEIRGDRLSHMAFYLEPELTFGSVRVRAGARLQYYLAIDKPALEPRLRVVWNKGIHQVSGAAGLYLQESVGLSDRRDAADVFTAWTAIPQRHEVRESDPLAGRLPRAVHVIAGYRIHPNGPWEASVEGYYKRLSSLFIAEWTAFPRFTTRLQPAEGRSFGFDARVEVRRTPFYALVSYGLSSTRYAAEQAAIALWYGVERLRFRPPHDRRHQVNALLSTSVRKFDLSVHWTFGSGLPFNRALGFDGFVLVDDLLDAFEVPKTRRVIYERPFNGLLPTYHRLDVSIGRNFDIKGAEVTVQASAINAYDRRNLFYLDVFTLQRVDELPFIPSLGLKVAFE